MYKIMNDNLKRELSVEEDQINHISFYYSNSNFLFLGMNDLL